MHSPRSSARREQSSSATPPQQQEPLPAPIPSPFSSTMHKREPTSLMGKDGHISSDVLVGVFWVQRICRSSRRGDPKITLRHRRHTCVSVFHHQRSFKYWNEGSAL